MVLLASETFCFRRFYYNIIIDGATTCQQGQQPPWACRGATTGFTMLRVRVRANAYFASSGAFTDSGRTRPNVNFNFSTAKIQGIVMLTGNNWRVQDNDILSTGTVFWSGGSAGGLRGTSYGLLSRNKIRNGGNALLMDQWKQVIVEDNDISGSSLSAMGNGIATYNGGYAQHIMLANNSIEFVWGDDREAPTPFQTQA